MQDFLFSHFNCLLLGWKIKAVIFQGIIHVLKTPLSFLLKLFSTPGAWAAVCLPGRKTGEGDDLGPVSKVCMCYVPLFSRGEASGTKLSFAAAV